jgi:hypothetical protein
LPLSVVKRISNERVKIKLSISIQVTEFEFAC